MKRAPRAAQLTPPRSRATSAGSSSGSCSVPVGPGGFLRLRAAQAQATDASVVGFEDFNVEAAEVEARAGRGYAARLVDDEAGDGREVFVLDFEVEQALDLSDLGRAEHVVVAFVRLDDLFRLLVLRVLVLYLADDLFQDVLDRH